MNEKLHHLQMKIANYSLLYVEDNSGLRHNIETLLGQLVHDIHLAKDGSEGYEIFKNSDPDIVITDLMLPECNGFELVQKMRRIKPDIKVIVMSAYDEKEHLYQAINHGIFRYLRKPARVGELIEVLTDAVDAIKEEEHFRLFQNQVQEVFNYQNHLVMMLEKDAPVLVNKRFLDFFGVDDISSFAEKKGDMGNLLLEHKSFLHSTAERNWFEHAKENPGKLFHAKIANVDNENRHLILKVAPIPYKENYLILTMDDVTELNLMALFDSEAAASDQNKQLQQTILNMMKVLKDNAAQVKIHNFYKGLTITNPGVVISTEDKLVIKTTFTQLKALNTDKATLLTSEIFPQDIVCKGIDKIDFGEQTVTIGLMQFTERSPTERRYVRLEPEPDHKITLFYRNIKLSGEMMIVDISEVSIKVQISFLPAGIDVEEKLRLSIVLPVKKGTVLFNTEGTVYRIDEHKRYFEVIVLFALGETDHQKLKNYLAERQMALIREFKNLGLEAENCEGNSKHIYSGNATA